MTEKNWLQNKWRPISAMVYLCICVFDFIIFPVLWAIFLLITDGAEKSMMWDPLSLKGSGVLHLSFGAILGVSAFTRGQEKVAMARSSRYSSHDYRHNEYNQRDYSQNDNPSEYRQNAYGQNE